MINVEVILLFNALCVSGVGKAITAQNCIDSKTLI